MSHDITNSDNVVLHKKAAWHGLGTIVTDAPTPREALKLAGLDWSVYQADLLAVTDEGNRLVEKYVANMRNDNHATLAVVGRNYRPVQNTELADFSEAIGKESGSLVETMGSIQGGRKVWCLIKGETIEVGGGDLNEPYMLVMNSHDGNTGFRVVPTIIRVVCKNTLGAVVPLDKTAGKIKNLVWSSKHTESVLDRIEEARKAIAAYASGVDQTRKLMNTLAAKDVSAEQVQAFWLDMYQRHFQPIPVNPETKVEQNRREKALDAVTAMSNRFDREPGKASAWKAYNAYTGWLQNDTPHMQKASSETKAKVNLIGHNSLRTSECFAAALSI